jgi:hypothetical protein
MEKGEGMKHWIESIISVNFLHYLCKLNKNKLDIFQRLHEIYNCNLIFCMIVCQVNGLILNNVKKMCGCQSIWCVGVQLGV